jgi:4-amino-4-deoxy-L-arabinose transferase-like glycosyltransferase
LTWAGYFTKVSAVRQGVLAIALATASAAFLPLLRPVLPVDETRYLTVAWEMYRDGTYLVPHLNGAIYGHKPPLLFWLINLVWSVFGVSEAAARIIAPAFGVLAVALTWIFGRMLFPEREGLDGRAALILASTGIFALYGSLTMFDTMLTCATLLGVIALVWMDSGGGPRATALLGAALAFGVLAKGPVILVHLLPLALSRPVWSRATFADGSVGWYLRLFGALGVALALLSLWLGPALFLGGAEYRDEVLWRQSAGRVINAFDHARPFWFFAAVLPLVLWPWAWRVQVLQKLTSRDLWQNKQAQFLAIWSLGTIGLFSIISGKQIHYLLPVLPAFAIALAAAPLPRKGFGPALAGLVVIVPVLIWTVLLAAGRAEIDGSSVTTLGTAEVIGSISIGVVGLVVLILTGLRDPLLGWALVTPVTLAVMHLALRAPLMEHFDTARFVAELSRAPEAGLAVYGLRYQGEFGFTARLSGPVDVIKDGRLEAWAGSHPGGLIVSGHDLDGGFAKVAEGSLAGEWVRFYRLR